MVADELDTRKKHRRSTDEEADEGSKRRKHSHHRQSSSHHRRRHRHRSSKNRDDSKYEEDDSAHPFVLSSNSYPDDEKEEGEILEEEEEDCGAVHEEVLKKKMDSDVESGEIKPDEVVGRSDNRDPGIRGERSSPGKSGELEASLNLLPGDSIDKNAQSSRTLNIHQGDDALNVYQGDDVACNLSPSVRNESSHHLTVHSDVEDEVKNAEVSYLRDSRTGYSPYRDKEHDAGDIDALNAGSENIRSREKKREMQGDIPSRDGGVSCANGDIGHKSHKEERRQHRVSGSPLKASGKVKNNKESDENDSRRYARSRSPAAREDVRPRRNRKIDDSGGGVINNDETELRKMYDSRLHSASTDAERNGSGDRNKSVSPEGSSGKYKTLSYSPYHEKYYDEAHRSRSKSRDNMRGRSSRSQSVKSHKDDDDRIELFDSREKETNNYDRERVRYSMEDRHGSRDWVRDGERERSYCRYSDREARHSSREAWDRDRERIIERESDENRDRDKNRNRDWKKDWEKDREKDKKREKDGDRDGDRGRSRDREREREKERDREREKEKKERGRDKDRGRETENDRVGRHHKYDGRLDAYDGLDRSKDSRHSKHAEWDYHDRKGRKDPVKLSSIMEDDLERREKKSQRDKEEEEEYEDKVSLQLEEHEEDDVDRIKEESRKRRQAILEKYKQQQHQSPQQAEPHGQASNKEEYGSLNVDKVAEQSVLLKVVNSTSDVPEDRNDSPDADFPEPTFSVWKSPPRNGTLVCGSTSGAESLGDGTPKSERSADMFCDDIFGESPAGVRKMGKGDGLHIERSGLHDNWDDAEGYYSYRFGEILDGRYEVTAAHGKGVFSTVVRAKDLKAGKGDPGEVAIKIIRNNDTMYKAGLEELIILKKLAGADPENRRHCVRFISSFKYRNHLCLVFESLHMNLREVLKKFGRNIGLNLAAVREYAKQLFIALKHLRNCGVLHCDIKPDNMLVNEAKNVLKLCDFGNAMFAGKNEITPYLVSRFYRAPEIILGLPYDHPMDMWSVGCCLYELYSGKVLFPGPSNNDMLRLHMELKGPFPKKMLRKGAFTNQHFDQDLNFHATEEDPVTKKTVKRLLLNIRPKEISSLFTSSPGEDPKMLSNFKDLLEKVFLLDPEKRMTVSQALTHPFITGK